RSHDSLTSTNTGVGGRVFYIGTDDHVHWVRKDGVWKDDDITASGGAVPPDSGTITCVDDGAHTAVYYIDKNFHVRELSLQGTWIASDVTSMAAGVSVKKKDGALTCFYQPSAGIRIYFVGSDGQVQEFAWQGSRWTATTL
uniref:hypothetical protein n=1 Tax=Aquisphaera insulae TaxID=2712864 RepID=UPI00196B060B